MIQQTDVILIRFLFIVLFRPLCVHVPLIGCMKSCWSPSFFFSVQIFYQSLFIFTFVLMGLYTLCHFRYDWFFNGYIWICPKKGSAMKNFFKTRLTCNCTYTFFIISLGYVVKDKGIKKGYHCRTY